MSNISNAMRERGTAVGLTPDDGESSQKFGARVRKAEKANTPVTAKPSGKREPLKQMRVPNGNGGWDLLTL